MAFVKKFTSLVSIEIHTFFTYWIELVKNSFFHGIFMVFNGSWLGQIFPCLFTREWAVSLFPHWENWWLMQRNVPPLIIVQLRKILMRMSWRSGEETHILSPSPFLNKKVLGNFPQLVPGHLHQLVPSHFRQLVSIHLHQRVPGHFLQLVSGHAPSN